MSTRTKILIGTALLLSHLLAFVVGGRIGWEEGVQQGGIAFFDAECARIVKPGEICVPEWTVRIYPPRPEEGP